MMNNETEKTNDLIKKESQDVFELFDKLDDEVIIAELEHKVIDTWVYHFPQEGKDIWGIGKAGIDGSSDMLGKKGIALREDFVKCEQDPTNPEFMLFNASASKYLISSDGATEVKVNSAIGTKRQWTMIRRKSDGHLMINKFWYEQGSMKALRNAKARLIDDKVKAMIIAYAKQHKKVKTVEMPTAKKQPEKKTEVKEKENKSPEIKQEKSSGQKKLWAGEQEEEKPVAPPFEKAKQEELMRITRAEATLVDKYGFAPDEIFDKLEKKFGIKEIYDLSASLAIEVAEFLEDTIKANQENTR